MSEPRQRLVNKRKGPWYYVWAKQVRSVHQDEQANQLLAAGWSLLSIQVVDVDLARRLCYVLGKGDDGDE